jgi:hypothetical protein
MKRMRFSLGFDISVGVNVWVHRVIELQAQPTLDCEHARQAQTLVAAVSGGGAQDLAWACQATMWQP